MGTNYYLRAKEPVRVVTYGPDGGELEAERSYSHPSLYDAALLPGMRGVELKLDDFKDTGMHLCKLSWGWVPLFERHPGTLLTSWEGVSKCVRMPCFDVIDEYGDTVGPQEFEDLVLGHTERYRAKAMEMQGWCNGPLSHSPFGDDADPGGYPVEWTDNQFS